MGPFPYTPSLFEETFSREQKSFHSTIMCRYCKKILSRDDLKSDVARKWKFHQGQGVLNIKFFRLRNPVTNVESCAQSGTRASVNLFHFSGWYLAALVFWDTFLTTAGVLMVVMFFLLLLLYIRQVCDSNKPQSGGHDEDLDGGCLRGLGEREMIKGGEFLLISKVSAAVLRR